MSSIKYISFDLWLTLIKSHPQFKQKRAELLADRYNPQGLACAEIMNRVNLVDKLCDQFNEHNEGKVAAEMMYAQVLLSLGNPVKMITNRLLVELKLAVHQMFDEYPPVFLNEHISTMLHQLKGEGRGLNLSSNTGFIEGDCLIEVLKALGINHCFDFCIFSDRINASKPSAHFFNKVMENRPGIHKQELLHVGDNSIADYKGAIDFGFNALLITNQQYTIDVIRKAILSANH